MPIRFRFGPASGGEDFPIMAVDLVDELTQLTISNLTAWVDTGADGTLVPHETLQNAGFRPNRQRRRFYTIRPEQAPEIVVGYSVLLRIGTFAMREVDVFASRTISKTILGRDVLNRMVLTYNGPQKLLEILTVDE
jgi:predicted aspartyl protease